MDLRPPLPSSWMNSGKSSNDANEVTPGKRKWNDPYDTAYENRPSSILTNHAINGSLPVISKPQHTRHFQKMSPKLRISAPMPEKNFRVDSGVHGGTYLPPKAMQQLPTSGPHSLVNGRMSGGRISAQQDQPEYISPYPEEHPVSKSPSFHTTRQSRPGEVKSLRAAREGTESTSSKLPTDPMPPGDEISLLEEPKVEIPLKRKAFKQYIENVLKKVEGHHKLRVSHWLARSNATSNSDRSSAFKSDAKLDAASPFANMAVIQSRRPPKSTKGGFQEQILATYLPTESHSKNEESTLVQQPLLFHINAYEVPPYTHFISSNHNILVESIRQRTFLPYLGEDGGDIDDDYRALLSKFDANQLNERNLLEGEEFGLVWLPYVHRMLIGLGTSVSIVLRFLIDTDEVTAPDALPIDLAGILAHKAEWIGEGFFEEEDDHDVTMGERSLKRKQPQKKWQHALSSLPKGDDRQMAATILACHSFKEVEKFSLWYVVRLTPEAEAACLSHNQAVSIIKDQHKNGFGIYENQACIVCKAHQCLGHGEYAEDDDHRKPMVAGSGTPPIGVDGNDITASARGISGINGYIRSDRNDPGFEEPLQQTRSGLDNISYGQLECCSKDCWWRRSERPPEKTVAIWSKKEIEWLVAYGPEYAASARGACTINKLRVLDKTCMQIYARLSQEISANISLRQREDRSGDLPHENRHFSWWLQNSLTWKHQYRKPFRPCNHHGICKDNPACSCDRQHISCEKSCNCSMACARRFRGCRCAARGKPCYESDACDCFRLNRECDPDICLTCGANEVLDPSNRYDHTLTKGKCCNVPIMKALPKRTQLGQSKLLSAGGVSGWGLFMGETTKKGEYIGEYVGEVITGKEAERRGIIYNAMKLSYLFDLNSKQVLDSTPIGNKLRYINHQGDDFANCRAKVMLCNGVQRIGMFATKNIEIGEELLFNYGDDFASKIDMVTMHKDGSVTVEAAERASQRLNRMSDGEGDHDDDEYPHRKPKRGLISGARHYGSDTDSNSNSDAQSFRSAGDEGDDTDGDVSKASGRSGGYYVKSKKKTTGSTAAATRGEYRLPNGMTGTERMMKAWITRYANLGKHQEAEAQRKRVREREKIKKRSGNPKDDKPT